ncbi:amidohydrolase family protein [Agromyces marinus]|uniref:Imidazolonepropionase n=1 Tax=Agromyces marinus TaxID=1389020 RepID=A0ABM8H2X5_9MICO|nr:hypothetical protein [Agromyces marinus]UIP59791.1 hypothetical protein DSM26151_27050 [Agromyces marinus]BDZ55124.1 hypothetical protein GCM10025870_21970 [Agromyces marinus]
MSAVRGLGKPVRRSLNGDRPGETGTMLPPLVDHHVHVQLDAGPAPGIAAVVDLGANPGAVASLAGRDGWPRMRFAGAFLTARGGYPGDRPWAPAGSVRELDAIGPDAASERRHHALAGPVQGAVDEQLRFGASVVKVVLNSAAGPVLDRATLDAVIAAARAAGLPVAAHAEGDGMAELAIRAGVDVLVHTPFTELLDDTLIGRAASAGQAWISTLAIHVRDDPRAAELAIDNLARFRTSGGRVLYGTDRGNGELAHGIVGAEIVALMRAGLTAAEVIESMTDPWPEPTPAWVDAGVATFVPDPAPGADAVGDPEAVAAWLGAARVVPTEELELL